MARNKTQRQLKTGFIGFRPAPAVEKKLNELAAAFGYNNKTEAIEFSIQFATNKLLGKKRRIHLKI